MSKNCPAADGGPTVIRVRTHDNVDSDILAIQHILINETAAYTSILISVVLQFNVIRVLLKLVDKRIL